MEIHVGLDRHIYEQSIAKQNDDPNTESSDADAIKNKNHKNIASSINYNDSLASPYPSQLSHPSQSTDTSITTKIMNATTVPFIELQNIQIHSLVRIADLEVKDLYGRT